MEKVILVTNDDGVEAEGLKVLSQFLKEIARVVVVAPEREKSGASHAVSLNSPLRVEKISPHRMKVDGTPADCVMLAVKKLLRKRPSLVVAGINPGPNLGDDVNYSGTVSAALEGAMLGIPSFSISMAARDGLRFDTAAYFAVKIAGIILSYGLPPRVALNVNVPNLEVKHVKGVVITRQGLRVYKDKIVVTKDPIGKPVYWITGEEPGWEDEEETDFKAIENNMVSVTPLHPDLTSFKTIAHLLSWGKKIYESR